jgi:flagellar biosynthesis protein FlhA
MAIDTGMTTGNLVGEETKEPAFGKRAFWIDPSMRQQAEIYGYRVVECAAVLATHLQEVSRKHAEELLTRDVTKQLIDQLKKNSPTVVDELIPSVLKLSEVQQVLQNLLREDVPIRQLSTILETLGDYATRIKDPIWLTEYVRHRLARTISHRYRDQRGVVCVLTMDPAMEDRIAAGFEHTDRGLMIRMSPAAIKQTCIQIANAIKKHEAQMERPILLVSPRIRQALRRITSERLPDLRILCHNEITRDTNTEAVGMVTD